MKNYKNKEDLINDLKSVLKDDNPFDKYILDRLGNPRALVQEFRDYPQTRLISKIGWFFVWKNNVIEIDGEWIRVEDLLNKLGEFLDKEAKSET